MVKESIDAWVTTARPVGGFLYAVLTNDLKEAFKRADIFNMDALRHIVAYLYWEAPLDCWGNEEKVKRWEDIGGQEGMNQLQSNE
jgi:hypothetical protein